MIYTCSRVECELLHTTQILHTCQYLFRKYVILALNWKPNANVKYFGISIRLKYLFYLSVRYELGIFNISVIIYCILVKFQIILQKILPDIPGGINNLETLEKENRQRIYGGVFHIWQITHILYAEICYY